METIILGAIIILMVVFIGSLLALVLICAQRRLYLSKKASFFSKHFNAIADSQPDNAYLIVTANPNHPHNLNNNNNNNPHHNNNNNSKGNENLELDDVRLHPNIDQILSDTQWVDDATGLIPHCLAVLKGAHHLTERLVAATMATMPRFSEADQQLRLSEIGRIARTISPRVDDVVEAMYPPLDPRLLESRCLSLLLSVSRFAIVITYTCAIRGQWIDDELKGLEMQLKILRDAGQALLNDEMNCTAPAAVQTETAEGQSSATVATNPAMTTPTTVST